MTNFDGQAEAAAIFDRLKVLVGGRVYLDIPDDANLVKDPLGKIRPFIHLGFGDPIPATRGRSLGRENVQPYILPVSVTSAAASTTEAGSVAAGVRNLLIGWAPPLYNAGQMKGGTGRSLTRVDAQGAPTRRERVSNYELLVNLAPALG